MIYEHGEPGSVETITREVARQTAKVEELMPEVLQWVIRTAESGKTCTLVTRLHFFNGNLSDTTFAVEDAKSVP